MSECQSSNPLFPTVVAKFALGLILTAEYVSLSTSSPLHNGCGYVSGALLSPLTAIPHYVGPTSPAPSSSNPYAIHPGVLGEPCANMSWRDVAEQIWLSLRLLDISTNDREMWVRPAVYPHTSPLPQLTRVSHHCNSNVSMT